MRICFWCTIVCGGGGVCVNCTVYAVLCCPPVLCCSGEIIRQKDRCKKCKGKKVMEETKKLEVHMWV